VIRGRELQIWIEKDWGQTTEGIIYGYSAFCKKKREENTGWRTKCHTIDCARNTLLLLRKHLISGTELILIGWKIVPNE
jgi:hypothetical protein